VALKGDAAHWLREQPEYAVLLLRLENAHAAVEAALILWCWMDMQNLASRRVTVLWL
jgi:hypothetical protein